MTMLAVAGSIVRTRAISQAAMGVNSMDNEQFDRELKYQVSMSIVRSMLEKGLISMEDASKWQQRLIDRYNPPIGGIVSNRAG